MGLASRYLSQLISFGREVTARPWCFSYKSHGPDLFFGTATNDQIRLAVERMVRPLEIWDEKVEKPFLPANLPPFPWDFIFKKENEHGRAKDFSWKEDVVFPCAVATFSYWDLMVWNSHHQALLFQQQISFSIYVFLVRLENDTAAGKIVCLGWNFY